MKNAAKKTAFLGLCTALALVLAYVEVLIPPIITAIPGIKIGLPNIVIIFLLYRQGIKEAALVSVVRVVAVALLFGNVMGFAYSIAGAVLSLLGMLLLKKLDFMSVVGVSVAGGVLHNVGQIAMAMILLGTAELGYYLIVLAVTGTISGVLIGICGALMIKRIPEWK
ncbi:MAG: Gx transporter family protein [Clostridia bacterium]|nr:Gx transporter family protein [Oscillospiraceae bacterium]MBR2446160.1 Gx transporter family protein [Clostridia bacterium]